MTRRTIIAFLAGGLFAATAALAIPVKPDPARDAATSKIHFSWSHATGPNGYVDDTWWATRGRCAPNYLGERLLCDAFGLVARTASRSFEAKMSDDTGLPLADRWGSMTAKNSPSVRSLHVETPLALDAVLGFYRTVLPQRGWIEHDGATIGPDRAVIAFTTSDGPAQLRLVRHANTTTADLSLRKPAASTGSILPPPGQVRLLLGNLTNEVAEITVEGRNVTLAARSGEKVTEAEIDKLPERQKIDLAPGKHEVTLKREGHAAQTRIFEVAANETWGLLVGPEGTPLPVRVY